MQEQFDRHIDDLPFGVEPDQRVGADIDQAPLEILDALLIGLDYLIRVRRFENQNGAADIISAAPFSSWHLPGANDVRLTGGSVERLAGRLL